MDFSKNTSASPLRLLTALIVLALVIMGSPAITDTLHDMVHARGLIHSHGPEGSEHAHHAEDSTCPSFAPIHIELPSVTFVSPLKSLGYSVIALRPGIFNLAFLPSKAIPPSNAPPAWSFLRILLVSHLNKAPPQV